MESNFKSDHLPNIDISIIDHHEQRYDTAGDYRELSAKCWEIMISKMPDWRYEALVLVHELVEMILTRDRGISWADIDKFDFDNPELADPGTCPKAPYHLEHMLAMEFEKRLCILLGIDWEEYDKSFNVLEYEED